MASIFRWFAVGDSLVNFKNLQIVGFEKWSPEVVVFWFFSPFENLNWNGFEPPLNDNEGGVPFLFAIGKTAYEFDGVVWIPA